MRRPDCTRAAVLGALALQLGWKPVPGEGLPPFAQSAAPNLAPTKGRDLFEGLGLGRSLVQSRMNTTLHSRRYAKTPEKFEFYFP